MSTVYDKPCPEPSEDEWLDFASVVSTFEDVVYSKFGQIRGTVLIDNWHVSCIASDITAYGERNRAFRILSDLNEEIRLHHFVDHMEWGKDENSFHPWLLIPT